jgi:acyl-CoA thioester hydrolase
MNDNAALQGFPVVIEIPVAWGEMDSFGHVNNIVYFRYFESARIAYFDAIGFRGDDGIGPILASTHCRFRLPLTYPDTVRVGARAHDTGTDRFMMDYCVVSTRLNTVAAEGGGLVVAYDYSARTKASLPDAVRERLEALEHGVL